MSNPASHLRPLARTWRDSVFDALRRVSVRHGTKTIDRQTLLAEERDRIVFETRTRGKTPDQNVSYYLQQLAKEGVLEFVDDRGTYRLVKQPIDIEAVNLSDEEIDSNLHLGLLTFGDDHVKTGSEEGKARRRRGQDRIRALTLRHYRSRCAVCDVSDLHLLIAGHIVPWAEDVDARGKLSNVICVCRFHDSLFESGYWSIADDLTILRRAPITAQTIRLLLPESMRFSPPVAHSPDANYLQYHRRRWGFEADIDEQEQLA